MSTSVNLSEQHSPDITVYPIGWLQAWQIGRHMPGRRLQPLRRELRYNLRQAKAGKWRAVRNTFGGYRAEHRTLGRRCGTGWTKRRAINDLYRHLAEEASTR